MLKIKIVTPEKVVYENEVFQASIPTMSGEITVLPHHIPLVTVMKSGELHLKDKSGDVYMAVSGGFAEVRGNNEIILLSDHAERVEEIDLQRAEEARKRAEEEIKLAKNVEDVDFAKLQGLIDRNINRIRVANKYRKLPPHK